MASFSCCSQGLWKIKIYITSTLAATPFNHGLPRWLSGKESACQCRRCGFSAWVRKILWRRKWQPTPVWEIPWTEGPGRLWGHKESDITEHTRPFNLMFHNLSQGWDSFELVGMHFIGSPNSKMTKGFTRQCLSRVVLSWTNRTAL